MARSNGAVGEASAWGRLIGRVRLLVFVAIVLVTLLLALAWVWPHSYREEAARDVAIAWAMFMLRTLSFHIGLGVLALTLLHLALRAWLRAAAALPALAMCLGPTAIDMLPLAAKREVRGETVRVMTFNVLGVNRAHDAVSAEILRHEPDVVVLQESNNVWHKALLLRLGERYPHVARLAWNDWIGMSVFSKREVHGAARVLEGHGRDALRFEIDLAGERCAVYAIHPPHPVTLENVRASRHLFADLRRCVAGESVPTMIVGDCNWDSNSPQDAALARIGFRDGYDLASWGRGSTWSARGWRRFLPGFRIDHVYIGAGLWATGARVGRPAGSDHRPVIVDVGRSAGD